MSTTEQPAPPETDPPPHDEEQAATEAGSPAPASRVAKLRAQVHDIVQDLPDPITERQPSAREIQDYSKRGIWTTELAGRRRSAHQAYTNIVAVPVVVTCDWIKYIVARPERFGFTLLTAALLTLGTVLTVFWMF